MEMGKEREINTVVTASPGDETQFSPKKAKEQNVPYQELWNLKDRTQCIT